MWTGKKAHQSNTSSSVLNMVPVRRRSVDSTPEDISISYLSSDEYEEQDDSLISFAEPTDNADANSFSCVSTTVDSAPHDKTHSPLKNCNLDRVNSSSHDSLATARGSSAKTDRKTAKQITERKRRDRINALMNSLRTLILKLLHKNPKHHRKLEKADVLELVVSFLKRELSQNGRRSIASRTVKQTNQAVSPQELQTSVCFPAYPRSRMTEYSESTDPNKIYASCMNSGLLQPAVSVQLPYSNPMNPDVTLCSWGNSVPELPSIVTASHSDTGNRLRYPLGSLENTNRCSVLPVLTNNSMGRSITEARHSQFPPCIPHPGQSENVHQTWNSKLPNSQDLLLSSHLFRGDKNMAYQLTVPGTSDFTDLTLWRPYV
ncbi:unnamed protein product [Calicophoron daubneyi]|uniref:BHLH domain-containing protein n=1 Tax=Calicophoron daubneyi TaxID=300641 RepID=A0AAV2TTG8_CALDB